MPRLNELDAAERIEMPIAAVGHLDIGR